MIIDNNFHYIMIIKNLHIPHGGVYTAPSVEVVTLLARTPLASSVGLDDMYNVEPVDNDVFPVDD